MATAKKITDEEANEIHIKHMRLPKERVTVCNAGQWYDVRGMDEVEFGQFIQEILGRVPGPHEIADIDLKL